MVASPSGCRRAISAASDYSSKVADQQLAATVRETATVPWGGRAKAKRASCRRGPLTTVAAGRVIGRSGGDHSGRATTSNVVWNAGAIAGVSRHGWVTISACDQ